MDDLFDADLLRQVATRFPDSSEHACFLRDQEALKFQFRPDECGGLGTRKQDWPVMLHHLKADWLRPVIQRRRSR
jgi:hypothetical protein